jgi:hypothetical protein
MEPKLANQFWLTCIQTQTTLFKYEPEYSGKQLKDKTAASKIILNYIKVVELLLEN